MRATVLFLLLALSFCLSISAQNPALSSLFSVLPSSPCSNYSLVGRIPTKQPLQSIAFDGQRYYYAPTDAALGWIGVVDPSSSSELPSINYTNNPLGRPAASNLQADRQGHLYFFNSTQYNGRSVVTVDVSGKWVAQWTPPLFQGTAAYFWDFTVSRSGRRIAVWTQSPAVWAVEKGNVTSLLYPLVNPYNIIFWDSLAFNDRDELFMGGTNGTS